MGCRSNFLVLVVLISFCLFVEASYLESAKNGFHALANTTDGLGPLAALEGTWIGKQGWNVVSLPNEDDPSNFVLLIFDYSETITFTVIGATPNRGTGGTQMTYGLQYEQVVTRLSTNEVVHKEDGMWLISENPSGNFPIARMSSVPHGDVLLAQGTSRTYYGPPEFQTFSILPVNAEDRGETYFAPYFSNSSIPFPPENMNQFLVSQLQNQTIAFTTQLSVSSKNQGGVLSIPFITQNANIGTFDCDFYIETIVDSDGNSYLQLQYTQNGAMEFLTNSEGQEIIWPHGNISTLTKQS